MCLELLSCFHFFFSLRKDLLLCISVNIIVMLVHYVVALHYSLNHLTFHSTAQCLILKKNF